MHHGVIAAATSPERLVAAMNRRTSELVPGPAHTRLDEMDLAARDDGWPMAFGERDGNAYVFDTSLVLSAEFDLITALAHDLGATVVGGGAETTSGSFWLVAARPQKLIRAYWHCHTDMREAWSRGEPLPSEARRPLDSGWDGDGVLSAMRELGFDYEGWARSGPFRELFYSAKTFPAKGPMAAELEAFHARVLIPERARPKPTAVLRSDRGADVVPLKTKRKRWFGLFDG